MMVGGGKGKPGGGRLKSGNSKPTVGKQKLLKYFYGLANLEDIYLGVKKELTNRKATRKETWRGL